MAEETNDAPKRSKRRLRTSPQTVRERTEKLQQESAKPKRHSKARAFFGGFFWPLRALGRLLARLGRFLGRFRVFRWIGLVLVPPYFRNSWRELRQVTWPDTSTTFRLTKAVIVFSVFFGLIVYGVDIVLDKIFKEIILQ